MFLLLKQLTCTFINLNKQGVRFVIAIDSYERFEGSMSGLDSPSFPRYHPQAFSFSAVVSSLNASWKASIWYPFITSIELKGFTIGQFDSAFQTLDRTSY